MALYDAIADLIGWMVLPFMVILAPDCCCRDGQLVLSQVTHVLHLL